MKSFYWKIAQTDRTVFLYLYRQNETISLESFAVFLSRFYVIVMQNDSGALKMAIQTNYQRLDNLKKASEYQFETLRL